MYVTLFFVTTIPLAVTDERMSMNDEQTHKPTHKLNHTQDILFPTVSSLGIETILRRSTTDQTNMHKGVHGIVVSRCRSDLLQFPLVTQPIIDYSRKHPEQNGYRLLTAAVAIESLGSCDGRALLEPEAVRFLQLPM